MAGGFAMRERKISRRSLFDAFRGEREASEESTAPKGFSLNAFYEGRTNAAPRDSQVIPRFEVRRGVAFTGVVRVRQDGCLAWQRSFCSVCVERCPAPGAILVAQGKPRVDPARCTGCGICVAACPAPTNGFVSREPSAG